MGVKNRERRAAHKRKRKAQARSHPRSERLRDAEALHDLLLSPFLIQTVLSGAAGSVLRGDLARSDHAINELVSGLPPAGVQAVARHAGGLLDELVTSLVQGGWQPRDLGVVLSRGAGRLHVRLLGSALATVTSRAPRATTDHRWLAQLAALPGGDGVGVDLLGDYVERTGCTVVEAITACVRVLGSICGLPALPVLMPLPGTARVAASDGDVLGQEAARALARVRGLVAKAEATEYPEEAELLSCKAQELMARHNLAQRLVEVADDVRPEPQGLRLWLDAPYVDAKALLVALVAEANRCRAVHQGGLDLVTVVGLPRDLAATELLTTSLLVQASRAMMAAGSAGPAAAPRARSRSFRSSFLLAYAQRVGERLRTAAASAEKEVFGTHLPVLVSDDARVREIRDRLFPETVHKRTRINDHAGWVAGRLAADQAVLPFERSLPAA